MAYDQFEMLGDFVAYTKEMKKIMILFSDIISNCMDYVMYQKRVKF